MALLFDLARIATAEYPRFSDAEMVQRQRAIAEILEQHDGDHLVFCGANRFGGAMADAMAGDRRGGRCSRRAFVQYVNHAPQARLLADKAVVEWGGKSSIAPAIEILTKRCARRGKAGCLKRQELAAQTNGRNNRYRLFPTRIPLSVHGRSDGVFSKTAAGDQMRPQRSSPTDFAVSVVAGNILIPSTSHLRGGCNGNKKESET